MGGARSSGEGEGSEGGEDGADARGIVVPPMHAGLLASSGYVGAAGGLNMSGGDVEAVFSEEGVAHGLGAFFEVGEFLVGSGGVVQRGAVRVFESTDKGECAVPEEETFKPAVLLPCGDIRQMKFETEGMQMLVGVVEVGGEDGVGEGLLRDVGDPDMESCRRMPESYCANPEDKDHTHETIYVFL